MTAEKRKRAAFEMIASKGAHLPHSRERDNCIFWTNFRPILLETYGV